MVGQADGAGCRTGAGAYDAEERLPVINQVLALLDGKAGRLALRALGRDELDLAVLEGHRRLPAADHGRPPGRAARCGPRTEIIVPLRAHQRDRDLLRII